MAQTVRDIKYAPEAQKPAFYLQRSGGRGPRLYTQTKPQPFRRRNTTFILRWYFLLDALSLAAAFLTAEWLASMVNGHLFHRALYSVHTHVATLGNLQYFILACGVLLNFERLGHYKMRMPFWLERKHIFCTLGFAMIIDGFLHFASRQDFSRISLFLSWGLAALAIIVCRATYRAVMKYTNRWRIATLMVGAGPVANDVWTAVKSEPSLDYAITSHISDLPKAFREAGGSWEAICRRHRADYVLIALEGSELERSEAAIAELVREKVPFSIAPPMRHIPVSGMVPRYFINHDVMLLSYYRGLEQPLSRFIKRGFDIVAAGTALFLLSPLLALIALLIKVDGGPIFYGHKRIGYNGRIFVCRKFRSMIVNSEEILKEYLAQNPQAKEEWQREWKLRNDPRITRLGHFLRRTSLDELPQLLNVLRGHMSLVGPRPIVLAEREKYDDDIAYYYRVRPGITGLWQVSGRNDVSYESRVKLDAWYVRNWSLWHDLAIICKTLPVLLMRSGAY